MKSAMERMDMIVAYVDVGTSRGTTAICGTNHHTVKREVLRRLSGADAVTAEQAERAKNDWRTEHHRGRRPVRIVLMAAVGRSEDRRHAPILGRGVAESPRPVRLAITSVLAARAPATATIRPPAHDLTEKTTTEYVTNARFGTAT